MFTRRQFFATTTAAAGMALSPDLLRAANASRPVAAPAPALRTDAFTLGVAGYSMRDFSIEETLRWLAHWELRAWAVKDRHLPLDSTSETMAELRSRSITAGVQIYAAGVLYLKTEAEVAGAFAYAQRLGVKLIVAAPTIEVLPAVEKAVQATGIRLAIHNHGPDMDLFPTPASVYREIRSLDPGIGLCIDIGHTTRCGVDPAEAVEEYADRVFDLHIKDVDRAAKDGRTVALGRGVVDLHRLVRTLRQVGFRGVCGLEYEGAKEETLAGLAETVGYLRGVLRST